MKLIEFKNTQTGKVAISGEFRSLKSALEHGAKNFIDMSYMFLLKEKLNGAKLDRAKLSSSNLERADLIGATFNFADLCDANLGGAILEDASLISVNAKQVNLNSSNCQRANFEDAKLQGAKFKGADLRHARMSYAQLENADLRGANTYGTNFDGAYLSGAFIDPLLAARLTIIQEGDIIVWKRCTRDVVAKLLVPAKAKRSNSTSRKCRAEYVTTLELFGETDETNTAYSIHDPFTKYIVGETTHCDGWNEDRWVECTGGIHFFLTRIEAESYS